MIEIYIVLLLGIALGYVVGEAVAKAKIVTRHPELKNLIHRI